MKTMTNELNTAVTGQHTADGDVFHCYAPFIQDFIYQNNWKELRPVQVEAAEAILFSQDNVLICSKTASGKTEAAFFPVISQIEENPINGFSVIYVAPLKTLINDQFTRIDQLLTDSHIPLFHWHGDVSASHKQAALRNPQGILQITPESLEGLLLHHTRDIYRLFGNLEFVIIDEIHFLAGTDRGNQLRCILERLARLISHHPRRIGLSATIGKPEDSAEWLGENTGRDNKVIFIRDDKLRIRLGCEHFFTGKTNTHSPEAHKRNQNYGDMYNYFLFSVEANEFVYDCLKSKNKSIVFADTREETEHITAMLRDIAERRHDSDFFYAHHSCVAKELRQQAESDMKNDEMQTCACATLTMELGIDIGSLERVVNLGAPHTVSSLLQRLGRSGRRGNAPEMMLVINEDRHLEGAPFPHTIPWELLKAIAIVQLYVEEQWIEPPQMKNMPFSLLFHQTLCTLASAYEMSTSELIRQVLSLSTFRHIDENDYHTLLRHMTETGMMKVTDEGTLIVGLEGERLINSYKFLATFKDFDEYTVMHNNAAVGTLTSEVPVGERFTLAGYTWEVVELISTQKYILVKKVKGTAPFPWPGAYRNVHTKVLRQIRKILSEDVDYVFLGKHALERLHEAREIARSSGMLEKPIIHVGGNKWVLLPWLGTRSIWTLRRYIRARCAHKFMLSDIEYGDSYYIMFDIGKGDGYELLRHIRDFFVDGSPDLDSLVGKDEYPTYERYDEYVPQPMIRRGHIIDKMQSYEISEWVMNYPG